ncbi:MAG TPA: hypothetical protein VM577_21360 [Anaerovoracaceae bacterium]|nr:hypothetical protein [Anaerovoracaceae bacterium]
MIIVDLLSSMDAQTQIFMLNFAVAEIVGFALGAWVCNRYMSKKYNLKQESQFGETKDYVNQ